MLVAGRCEVYRTGLAVGWLSRWRLDAHLPVLGFVNVGIRQAILGLCGESDYPGVDESLKLGQ